MKCTHFRVHSTSEGHQCGRAEWSFLLTYHRIRSMMLSLMPQWVCHMPHLRTVLPPRGLWRNSGSWPTCRAMAATAAKWVWLFFSPHLKRAEKGVGGGGRRCAFCSYCPQAGSMGISLFLFRHAHTQTDPNNALQYGLNAPVNRHSYAEKRKVYC